VSLSLLSSLPLLLLPLLSESELLCRLRFFLSLLRCLSLLLFFLVFFLCLSLLVSVQRQSGGAEGKGHAVTRMQGRSYRGAADKRVWASECDGY